MSKANYVHVEGTPIDTNTATASTMDIGALTINGCTPINAVELTQSESTKPKQISRWKKGQSGNPSGRPRGTRNKVSEQFLLDLQATWNQATTTDDGLASTTGLDVIQAVATTDPSKLLAAMIQVLPKDFQLSVDTDQINWVINASPRLNELEWREQHSLPIIEDNPIESTG